MYQYTRKKFAKIPQNLSKYTQNYTQVYFIPEIPRKWYTEYPYLSCNIPYTQKPWPNLLSWGFVFWKPYWDSEIVQVAYFSNVIT